MSDVAMIENQIPVPAVIPEIFDEIQLGMKLVGMSDAVIIDKVTTNNTFNTGDSASYEYDEKYVIIEADTYKLNTEYTVVGYEGVIDNGKLSVVEINTEQFASVQGIEVEVE